MTINSRILFCNCAYYQIISDDIKSKVLAALEDSGVEFEAVTDLCEMSAKNDPLLKSLAEEKELKIVACFPRSVKWLFHAGSAPLSQEGVEVLNMRTSTAEEIICQLLDGKSNIESKQTMKLDEKGDWTPWFPVIDYDRCKNCMQCLNFCLFGVYELSDEGKVEVAKPAGCKTNCPACARVCPHKAIIFPKYTESPINGDDVVDENGEEQKTETEVSKLNQGDIYEVIRQHSKGKKRFAKDKADIQHLNISRLTKELSIPSEVLASLSPEELAHLKDESKGEKS
jgi:NAD-dependent dihydropyrimidine dehydrogenase PreA subunit